MALFDGDEAGVVWHPAQMASIDAEIAAAAVEKVMEALQFEPVKGR